MHAIIETGGKQYKVQAGDIISVEKLGVEAGEGFTFDKVLGIVDGDSTVVGTPVVKGASVTGQVLGDGKAKKIIIYKYKAKKGYHRKRGHRQPFTRIKIEAVNPA